MNIAEGKGRFSSKEFLHFLYIARGSLYETMTLVELFVMQRWIDNDTYQALDTRAEEIARMLNGLISPIKIKE